MGDDHDRTVVPGITLTRSGQATVAPELTDVLFDLALELEERTDLPVDIEHVLAAVVMAAAQGELDSGIALSADEPSLLPILAPHIQSIFADHGGELGRDDLH